MEWFEVLGCWNVIIKGLEKIQEENERYKKEINKKNNSKIESFKNKKTKSEYAKNMRKKIIESGGKL
jgi:hypothetical protein